ncbi:UNVERIFIED_CONTAM: hypothetical protein HHA_251450 [Hammondia hammondi]|eukprot:XP_008888321.1 hypothetical protein HHA_251450 [Hammondia hammondi]
MWPAAAPSSRSSREEGFVTAFPLMSGDCVQDTCETQAETSPWHSEPKRRKKSHSSLPPFRPTPFTRGRAPDSNSPSAAPLSASPGHALSSLLSRNTFPRHTPPAGPSLSLIACALAADAAAPATSMSLGLSAGSGTWRTRGSPDNTVDTLTTQHAPWLRDVDTAENSLADELHRVRCCVAAGERANWFFSEDRSLLSLEAGSVADDRETACASPRVRGNIVLPSPLVSSRLQGSSRLGGEAEGSVSLERVEKASRPIRTHRGFASFLLDAEAPASLLDNRGGPTRRWPGLNVRALDTRSKFAESSAETDTKDVTSSWTDATFRCGLPGTDRNRSVELRALNRQAYRRFGVSRLWPSKPRRNLDLPDSVLHPFPALPMDWSAKKGFFATALLSRLYIANTDDTCAPEGGALCLWDTAVPRGVYDPHAGQFVPLASLEAFAESPSSSQAEGDVRAAGASQPSALLGNFGGPRGAEREGGQQARESEPGVSEAVSTLSQTQECSPFFFAASQDFAFLSASARSTTRRPSLLRTSSSGPSPDGLQSPPALFLLSGSSCACSRRPASAGLSSSCSCALGSPFPLLLSPFPRDEETGGGLEALCRERRSRGSSQQSGFVSPDVATSRPSEEQPEGGLERLPPSWDPVSQPPSNTSATILQSLAAFLGPSLSETSPPGLSEALQASPPAAAVSAAPPLPLRLPSLSPRALAPPGGVSAGAAAFNPMVTAVRFSRTDEAVLAVGFESGDIEIWAPFPATDSPLASRPSRLTRPLCVSREAVSDPRVFGVGWSSLGPVSGEASASACEKDLQGEKGENFGAKATERTGSRGDACRQATANWREDAGRGSEAHGARGQVREVEGGDVRGGSFPRDFNRGEATPGGGEEGGKGVQDGESSGFSAKRPPWRPEENSPVVTLTWHPSLLLLASGHASGIVVIWRFCEKAERTETSRRVDCLQGDRPWVHSDDENADLLFLEKRFPRVPSHEDKIATNLQMVRLHVLRVDLISSAPSSVSSSVAASLSPLSSLSPFSSCLASCLPAIQSPAWVQRRRSPRGSEEAREPRRRASEFLSFTSCEGSEGTKNPSEEDEVFTEWPVCMAWDEKGECLVVGGSRGSLTFFALSHLCDYLRDVGRLQSRFSWHLKSLANAFLALQSSGLSDDASHAETPSPLTPSRVDGFSDGVVRTRRSSPPRFEEHETSSKEEIAATAAASKGFSSPLAPSTSARHGPTLLAPSSAVAASSLLNNLEIREQRNGMSRRGVEAWSPSAENRGDCLLSCDEAPSHSKSSFADCLPGLLATVSDASTRTGSSPPDTPQGVCAPGRARVGGAGAFAPKSFSRACEKASKTEKEKNEESNGGKAGKEGTQEGCDGGEERARRKGREMNAQMSMRRDACEERKYEAFCPGGAAQRRGGETGEDRRLSGTEDAVEIERKNSKGLLSPKLQNLRNPTSSEDERSGGDPVDSPVLPVLLGREKATRSVSEEPLHATERSRSPYGRISRNLASARSCGGPPGARETLEWRESSEHERVGLLKEGIGREAEVDVEGDAMRQFVVQMHNTFSCFHRAHEALLLSFLPERTPGNVRVKAGLFAAPDAPACLHARRRRPREATEEESGERARDGGSEARDRQGFCREVLGIRNLLGRAHAGGVTALEWCVHDASVLVSAGEEFEERETERDKKVANDRDTERRLAGSSVALWRIKEGRRYEADLLFAIRLEGLVTSMLWSHLTGELLMSHASCARPWAPSLSSYSLPSPSATCSSSRSSSSPPSSSVYFASPAPFSFASAEETVLAFRRELSASRPRRLPPSFLPFFPRLPEREREEREEADSDDEEIAEERAKTQASESSESEWKTGSSRGRWGVTVWRYVAEDRGVSSEHFERMSCLPSLRRFEFRRHFGRRATDCRAPRLPALVKVGELGTPPCLKTRPVSAPQSSWLADAASQNASFHQDTLFFSRRADGAEPPTRMESTTTDRHDLLQDHTVLTQGPVSNSLLSSSSASSSSSSSSSLPSSSSSLPSSSSETGVASGSRSSEGRERVAASDFVEDRFAERDWSSSPKHAPTEAPLYLEVDNASCLIQSANGRVVAYWSLPTELITVWELPPPLCERSAQNETEEESDFDEEGKEAFEAAETSSEEGQEAREPERESWVGEGREERRDEERGARERRIREVVRERGDGGRAEDNSGCASASRTCCSLGDRTAGSKRNRQQDQVTSGEPPFSRGSSGLGDSRSEENRGRLFLRTPRAARSLWEVAAVSRRTHRKLETDREWISSKAERVGEQERGTREFFQIRRTGQAVAAMR